MKLTNQAFDLVEKFRRATTVDQVQTMFEGIAADSGACAFIICDIPPGFARNEGEIHASGWHPEWERKYVDKHYVEIDPVPNGVHRHLEPYFWRDLIGNVDRRSRGADVMHEARAEYRMHDGFCIPIHGLNDLAGLVSLASQEREWHLSEREQAALHLVGLYAYEAMRRIKRPPLRSEAVRLSPRELDCVRWMAEGKTAWETSTIIGVAEATVRTYIKSASRKLDTHSQGHLVARAHRLGLIQ